MTESVQTEYVNATSYSEYFTTTNQESSTHATAAPCGYAASPFQAYEETNSIGHTTANNSSNFGSSGRYF